MKNLAIKSLIYSIFLTTAFLFIFTGIRQNFDVVIKKSDLKAVGAASKVSDKATNPVNIITKEFSDDDDEEKVVISIVNFGRKNPFEPYRGKRGIRIRSEKKNNQFDDIPEPPLYSGEVSKDIETLMASTINGILYDPYDRSVAIVNINGTEYMVHKGDLVHGMLIKDISEKAVTLQYGNNTYTMRVGDIIEGEVKGEDVQRNSRVFAGTGNDSNYIDARYTRNNYEQLKDYELPDINLEE
jgi:hypothetical protein